MSEITQAWICERCGTSAAGARRRFVRWRSKRRLPGDRFDFVFAGAGHNSLICAAYLAKGGYKVLVLEGRPTIGGGTKTAEVCMPGFKEDLCSSVHAGIANNPLSGTMNFLCATTATANTSIPIPSCTFLFWMARRSPFGATWTAPVKRSRASPKKTRKHFGGWWPNTRPTPRPRARAAARSADGGAPKIPKAGVWQRRMAMSGYDLVCELYESDYMRRANLVTGHFGSVPGGDPGTGAQAFRWWCSTSAGA